MTEMSVLQIVIQSVLETIVSKLVVEDIPLLNSLNKSGLIDAKISDGAAFAGFMNVCN
jgi:hypothetical protein